MNELKTLNERKSKIEQKLAELDIRIDQSSYVLCRRKIRTWVMYLYEISRTPDAQTYRDLESLFQDYENVVRPKKQINKNERQEDNPTKNEIWLEE